jgi:hypothetical protein
MQYQPEGNDQDFMLQYRCCLSVVFNEYRRIIRFGFLEDPERAIDNYCRELQSVTGFSPDIAGFSDTT